MLYIETFIGPSKIQGIGLFANEFVKKETIIWKFTLGFDLKFTKEEISLFPPQIQSYLKKYSWLSDKSGKYCFCSDEGKYCNHSYNPNVLSAYYEGEEEVVSKALRDIEKGEEITDNYSSFEKDFKNW
ncbi:MAG: SET domain-containing protein [Nanoarchaeota archaeon]|nr:SET domain-containing protein [Nanoarchaeota archaeon]